MEINRVYNLDVFDFLNKVEEKSIDLAVIDPPYNQKIDEWDNFESEEKYFEFTFKWIDELLEKMKSNGSIYIFNNPYNAAIIFNYLIERKIKFRNWIVWNKKDGFSPSRRKYVNNQEVILFFTISDDYVFNYNDIRIPYLSSERIKHASKKGIIKNGKRWFPNPNGKMCSDVWNFSSVRHNTKVKGKIIKSLHPTPKPLEMIERIVKASSNKNDIVLDLFSGTGTTSLAAKRNNRKYLGCENNSEYFSQIEKRLKRGD